MFSDYWKYRNSPENLKLVLSLYYAGFKTGDGAGILKDLYTATFEDGNTYNVIYNQSTIEQALENERLELEEEQRQINIDNLRRRGRPKAPIPWTRATEEEIRETWKEYLIDKYGSLNPFYENMSFDSKPEGWYREFMFDPNDEYENFHIRMETEGHDNQKEWLSKIRNLHKHKENPYPPYVKILDYSNM